MKLNCGDIFSFSNNLKFDDSNICTKLLINFWHVNFFEVILLNVELFCALEVWPEVKNILVIRGNVLHQKYISSQKKQKFYFKHNIKVFRNSRKVVHFIIQCLLEMQNFFTERHYWICFRLSLFQDVIANIYSLPLLVLSVCRIFLSVFWK